VMESVVGRDIEEEVEVKMYKNIQEKIAPWKSLLHFRLRNM
jgi:hypothetical protein